LQGKHDKDCHFRANEWDGTGLIEHDCFIESPSMTVHE
jgi:hypothetical protein